MGLLLLVLFADLGVSRPPLSFGPYRIEVASAPPFEKRLTVRDPAGRVLYQLSDAGIEISFLDVTGDGVPELRVINDPHGSCCSGTEHFFTREGGFRELFAVDRGRGPGLTSVRDLDGDGRPELVFEITLWASDLIACTSSPGCRLQRRVVVGWDGHDYADRTRQFPSLSRELARSYRRGLDQDHRQQALAGYYGNAILAGDEPRARQWLDGSDREWLAAQGEKLRAEFLAAAVNVDRRPGPAAPPSSDRR